MQTASHIVKGGLVRGDNTRFGTHLDGHVAQGHPTLHAQCLNSFAAELDHVAGTARTACLTDDRQHDIFCCDTRCGLALNFNFHGFGAALLQGLGRQYVLNFRGADPEGQCAEGTVGGGMGVAADDGHPRQGNALLRPHHVDDALVGVIQIVQLYAKLIAVLDQLLHLNARHLA